MLWAGARSVPESHGTTLRHNHHREPAGTRRDIPAALATQGRNAMKRLLIVDDDAGMRTALEARFLRRGWQVDIAVNGDEAVKKFREEMHVLVITDVRMPGRDGFALLREIQATSPSTAVILLTAYACVPDAVEAM